ncbi:MAG: ornithine cyclodeaminase family protein [Synergistaceae bacterium]|nr:ornithine cyclodeaminase family protein [Synergistaceae bacterium]
MDILFVNAPDIEKLDLSNDEILGAVEDSIIAQGNGKTVIEPRVHLFPKPDVHGHFNILRGYIEPLGVAGVKVVGDYVYNYKKDLPSEMALLNLYDPDTGAPLAVIDATEITNMRTGALTAVGAKYLAKKKNRILGHLGARGTAFWNVVLLDHLYHFEEIRVNSKRRESAENFAERLRKRLGKPVVIAPDSESCLKGADIMVEATRLIEPQVLLKTEWVEPGTFVVPYGTVSAVELSLTDVMDKLVVDDWGQCRGGVLGSLRRHVETGKLSEETLYAELCEIAAGRKAGREREDERILFWHRGLSINDIALGYLIYSKALERGLGTKLKYR